MKKSHQIMLLLAWGIKYLRFKKLAMSWILRITPSLTKIFIVAYSLIGASDIRSSGEIDHFSVKFRDAKFQSFLFPSQLFITGFQFFIHSLLRYQLLLIVTEYSTFRTMKLLHWSDHHISFHKFSTALSNFNFLT